MSLTEKQRHDLKKIIKELARHRARHTELISVYIPQDYDMNKIIQHLQQEQGTASNIKSTSTRKNVIDALERMVQHLRLFKRTPENGLAVFSGNVAEREGQQDLQVWSVEPPVPLKTRIYRCDKQFVIELLDDILETKEVYGLVVMDRREGNVATLKGKTIIPLTKAKSNVPGKTRAGGQCLMKNSLVQLSDGSIKKIDLLHNPFRVKSMVVSNYAVKDSPITDKWAAKKNKIFKIITKNPRLVLEASKDHVFFVSTNKGIIEKAAEELKISDWLIMPEKIKIGGAIQKIKSKKYYNAFKINKKGLELIKKERVSKYKLQKELAKETGLTQTSISLHELGKHNAKRDTLKHLCQGLNIDFESFLEECTTPYMYRNIKLPSKLDKDFAQLLGYYLGDGSGEKDRISLFEQNKELALGYKKKFEKYFGIKISYRFRESKNYYQLRITSRPLVRLIENEFPEITTSKESLIPEKILKSDNKIVASFLRGLFDAEGYTHKNRGVGLGMNNKLLVQQLQMLLLRFGIISSFSEYDNKRNIYSRNPRYSIGISEKMSLELFKKHIGFSYPSKTKNLDLMIRNKSEKSSVRQIIVPGTKIRKIIEKAGYNKELFPKVSNFFYNDRMMGKATFKNSILAHVKDERLYKKLEKIYNYPFLPVKINKIKVTNRAIEMVDVSIKDRNFIANGLVVHNSAQRYARIREGAAKDFYKKIGDMMKEAFLKNKNLKGIIVGGPGPTKYDFVEGGYITNEVKKKIIAIKDLSYTGEFGLQELVDKSQDVLANEDIATEKKIMERLFELLSTKPGMVAYGEKDVMVKLKMGAVEVLLISDSMDDDRIDEFEEEARITGTEVTLISTETREGVQLKDLGKVAAILRYEIE